MPGIPQVWYLDLFAGKNDHEAVKRAGAGGHKEINRTNLSMEQIEDGLHSNIVQQQLELLRFRNTFPAFGFDASFTVSQPETHLMQFTWEQGGYRATLDANLLDASFVAKGTTPKGDLAFSLEQKNEE